MNEKQLVRSENDRWIGGVCAGLGVYLDIDPTIIRILFIILLVASGIGLPLYLVLWFFMPEADGSSGFDAFTVSQEGSENGRLRSVGLLLIGFGALFLLKEIGVLSWLSWGVIWPLLIIALGVYVLRNRATE